MIKFRNVSEPADAPLVRWQVEAYDEAGTMFPVGLAFVVELQGVAQLNYIFVGDAWRRQGYGSKLFSACSDRWPTMNVTGAMDGRAEKFLREVQSPVPKGGRSTST